MKPLSPPPDDEPPFKHPAFAPLYVRVLRDVADRRLEPAERGAAARALEFLLREQLVINERIATDVLTALKKSLDLPNVVRPLLVGLRNALGDDLKMMEWTTRAADAALAEGLIASFVTLLRILVGVRDFDGAFPTTWQLALIRAPEMLGPGRIQLAFLAGEYARRFGGDPHWVQTIRAQRLLHAARRPRVGDMPTGG